MTFIPGDRAKNGFFYLNTEGKLSFSFAGLNATETSRQICDRVAELMKIAGFKIPDDYPKCWYLSQPLDNWIDAVPRIVEMLETIRAEFFNEDSTT